MGFGFLCNSMVPLDHLYKNPDILGIIRKSDAWTTLDHLGPPKKKPTDMVGDFVMVGIYRFSFSRAISAKIRRGLSSIN